MKKTTIMIEDSDRQKFRKRLEEVLNRYNDERIFNIDTGIIHNKNNSQECPQMYYAIIIVRGNALHYEVSTNDKV